MGTAVYFIERRIVGMKLIYHKSIKNISGKWKKLEEGGISPFQSYKINCQVYQRRILYSSRLSKKMVYIEVSDNDETVIIIPLMKMKNGKWSSLGSMNGLKNYNIVYNKNENKERIISAIDYFFEKIGECVEFYDVSAESPLLEWAEQNKDKTEISPVEQIAIHYPDSYETYFLGLSKNARQNIRTVYNRMKKDEKEYRFESYKGQEVPIEDHTEMLATYCKRRKEKYNNSSLIHSIYLKHFDWQQKNVKIIHLPLMQYLK